MHRGLGRSLSSSRRHAARDRVGDIGIAAVHAPSASSVGRATPALRRQSAGFALCVRRPAYGEEQGCVRAGVRPRFVCRRGTRREHGGSCCVLDASERVRRRSRISQSRPGSAVRGHRGDPAGCDHVPRRRRPTSNVGRSTRVTPRRQVTAMQEISASRTFAHHHTPGRTRTCDRRLRRPRHTPHPCTGRERAGPPSWLRASSSMARVDYRDDRVGADSTQRAPWSATAGRMTHLREAPKWHAALLERADDVDQVPETPAEAVRRQTTSVSLART